jgi:hypothetical protein
MFGFRRLDWKKQKACKGRICFIHQHKYGETVDTRREVEIEDTVVVNLELEASIRTELEGSLDPRGSCFCGMKCGNDCVIVTNYSIYRSYLLT